MLVLVILGLIWGFVLIPPYLQTRRESRPGDSIASFRQQLHVLERTTPGDRSSNLVPPRRRSLRRPALRPPRQRRPARRPPVAAPLRRRPPCAAPRARRRRRDVFVTLLGAVGVTFLLAVALGGSIWMLHLLVDVVFVAYVALLVSLQQQTMREGAQGALHAAHAARRRPQPQLAVRRYGS